MLLPFISSNNHFCIVHSQITNSLPVFLVSIQKQHDGQTNLSLGEMRRNRNTPHTSTVPRDSKIFRNQKQDLSFIMLQSKYMKLCQYKLWIRAHDSNWGYCGCVNPWHFWSLFFGFSVGMEWIVVHFTLNQEDENLPDSFSFYITIVWF